MNEATSEVEVGVRELKNRLSHYLERVTTGDEIIVTMRGRPMARITPLGSAENRFDALVAAGIVRPPDHRRWARPAKRIRSRGPVSDLVADQRP